VSSPIPASPEATKTPQPGSQSEQKDEEAGKKFPPPYTLQKIKTSFSNELRVGPPIAILLAESNSHDPQNGRWRRVRPLGMEKLSARIENWSIVDNLIFHGFRQLEPGQRLTGYIMGHTNLPNGVIYTSVIQSVDPANGLVQTLNTVYQLGQVNEEYEQWAAGERDVRAVREVPIPAFVGDPRKPAAAYQPTPAYRHG
jgi:hypothetical protein